MTPANFLVSKLSCQCEWHLWDFAISKIIFWPIISVWIIEGQKPSLICYILKFWHSLVSCSLSFKYSLPLFNSMDRSWKCSSTSFCFVLFFLWNYWGRNYVNLVLIFHVMWFSPVISHNFCHLRWSFNYFWIDQPRSITMCTITTLNYYLIIYASADTIITNSSKYNDLNF